MVALIRSDLEFILEQIAIAERHAAGESLASLVSDPTQPQGLRTVDGTWNNLVEGREMWGAADTLFPRALTPTFGSAQAGTSYAQNGGLVVDSQPRTISNLIADQTTDNPAAVIAAGGPGAPVSVDGSLSIPNVTPDAGLSAPFNGWTTLFGQFFDHGLDLVTKGGSGTVFMPLLPGDPLYIQGSPTNFMVLTRATNQPGADGVLGTADDIKEHTNTTTSFVDQNQTYTSHPSHQVFLREYKMVDGKPLATGKLLDGADGGLVTWAEVKAQAREKLGIDLTDADVTNIPLLATDPYGEFIRGPNGFAQVVVRTATGTELMEGKLDAPISLADAVRTNHAFLDDIAHNAAPTGKAADADGLVNEGPIASGTYDNELLDAHYVTGDGRGNENIGLTAVHHVFHSEHNRLVQHIKDVVLATEDTDFIAQWRPDGVWDGERLFQAARFSTEMQYQHLVFEEFARRVQPNVDVFDAYSADVDPSIVAEFAHTVYRFGHSMLTDTVDRTGADGTASNIDLIEAFLNPLEFKASGPTPEEAAGAIVRGMTQQVGNEIDEFTVEALRNNLVGLPLDLPALNIARGRETGVPSLNEARRQFFAATDGDTALKPYESWAEFGLNIKHPASLVNFVAAYGTHSSVTSATSLDDKRAAAANLVLGGEGAPEDRLDFMNGTGVWANGANGVTTTGLDKVDFWIGGLAEKQLPFGGLLGSTFGFVFETQMERLQDGDRFYYLARTAGTNFLTQLESSTFAELVMRNTDAEHLHFNVFSTPAHTFEVTDPSTWNSEVVRAPNGIRYTGGEHVVMGGSENNDRLIAGEGDDALWGDGGNDTLEGGIGNDALVGGEGNDTLTDSFGDDVFRGDAGNDSINGGVGFDLILGGTGDDYVSGGAEEDEVFGGEGNDIVFAGEGGDEVFGNEGDDWLDGGDSGDLLIGDNNHPLGLGTVVGHDVFVGGVGTDRMEGEEGNDIFVGGEGMDRHIGQQGFDWITYFQDGLGIGADLTLDAAVVTPPPPGPNANLDRFTEVEGLSGTNRGDTLRGDDAADNAMTAADIALINGLSAKIGTSFTGGNIILGGGGSDQIEGRGGDDFIDGDAILQVSLTSRAPGGQIVREIVTPAAAAAGVDTAVFSGAAAEYNLIRGMAGSATVAHVGGTAADGTDTLRNVELLRFTDGTFLSSLPAGSVAVAGAAVENATLTASYAFASPALTNLATVAWRWEAETAPGVWTQVGTGTTLQLGDAEVGLRYRAVATFTDGLGTLGSSSSDPTAPVANVNDAPTGTVTVSDTTPTEGQVLTATMAGLADGDGLANATVAYRWQSSANGAAWTDIAGATGLSYTPDQAAVGQQIRFTVRFTDDHGTTEQVASAATSGTGDRFVGGAGAENVPFTAFADLALGEGGDDTLRGLAGDDTLEGGAGNDSLDGGAGADVMRGGAGDDVYVVDSVLDAVVELAGQGSRDKVMTTLLTFTLGGEIEDLTYTGAGAFTGTGSDAHNIIRGGSGADILDGGTGNDTIVGNAGDDLIFGGAGNDRILADAGNDTLDGGIGNDVFVYRTGFGNDRVVGFDADPAGGGQDRLELSGFGITAANFGSSVTLAQAGANTVVTVLAAGGGTITLLDTNAAAVTQSDFILV